MLLLQKRLQNWVIGDGGEFSGEGKIVFGLRVEMMFFCYRRWIAGALRNEKRRQPGGSRRSGVYSVRQAFLLIS
ncbi:hypothetical protein [Agrobacterium pusense]|uniref:hypothetical protein n=1 Tax=Agrobacterium pusense TaxID=648995 RepID=UPI001C6F55DA|nr:hypothetical protein [Agrobacterium pusense]MBW9066799.1 hypothetical protein [Agrobacterium pusense]MBW9083255.1 hypothetical protein [Agrobacterium pusense]MBW9125762.1 hypothetical protein [Agrobacterium pusense]MBW9135237.1 hypothetical protein [Agrobacterium pusense]